MKFAIVLFGSLIVLLLAGVIPLPGGQDANVVYHTPVFILLLILLSAASVWCCIKRKFSLKQAGFYLVHLGVVILLAGAFVGYVAGTKGVLQLFLMPPQQVGEVQDATGAVTSFGFAVSARDFEVKYYPPVYHLYRQVPPDQLEPGQMPFEKAGEFTADGQAVWNIEGLGPFEASNLWDDARQEWAQRRMLDAGYFLHRASLTPIHYGVTLQIKDGVKDVDLPIRINHPAGYGGWRFYLMSYDQQNRSYVVLSARHDPGRIAVIFGIWLVMIGTFVFCFRRERGVQ